MADAAVVLVTGALSGGFALTGVGLGNWMTGRRERRVLGREAALELADMEKLVWGDSWVDLNSHLQRQEALWAAAGVPAELIQDFRTISVACWRDLQVTVQRSAGQHPGIDSRLLQARESVHEAARAYLLATGSRPTRETLKGRASSAVRAASPRDLHGPQARPSSAVSSGDR